jgi:PhzF family phenazine biosynthesis protein
VTGRRIRHVDAFTSTPLEGNPAAVVDGDGLDGETMQRIALNQRLSETVFLLAPQSDANHAMLRIFTPATELPFAGHPIVAASHVLLSEGHVRLQGNESLRLETGAGVIPVELLPGEPPQYTMTQGTPDFSEAPVGLDEIAGMVGLRRGHVVRAERVSTGMPWLIAQLESFDAMREVRPDFLKIGTHTLAIFCLEAEAPEAAIRVRAFAPAAGVAEDPVTGSANGCIGAFIGRHGLLPRSAGAIAYVAEQGIELGQPGRVHVRVTDPDGRLSVQVGGAAFTVLKGELILDR